MTNHTWTFANIGGSVRVVITSGKDIEHLGELDEKLWTVLACPSSGLEIPDESLRCLDTNNDSKIHIRDVVVTAQWLCRVLHDAQVLFAGQPSLPLQAIKDADILSVATPLSSDGVITLAAVQAAIKNIAIDAQPLPPAPYSAEVIAAYHACQETYNQYFATLHLQSIGLASLPKDTPVPGISEEDFRLMAQQINQYEQTKATIEKANAAALLQAQQQFRPLEKLLLLSRDFCTLLRNFVSFQDFYATRLPSLLGRQADNDSPWAIFQAGTLVIDQRACHLCLRVGDLSKHNAQAADSGMYLIYCHCTLHATGEKMHIVAAMTVGDVRNLKVGKNALFYDRQGRDWEAEVIKIVDNPISIGQAFWSPYRKLGNWVSGIITKSASEKETKSFAELTAKLQTPAKPADKPASPVQPFDIARFAGIFAAIGMAIGALGTFLTGLLNQFYELKWWALLVVPVLLLVISGPSMVLAWMKLRKRNIAPLLNANGWAINADAIVSVLFGNTLTDRAQFPMIKSGRAVVQKGLSRASKWWIALGVLLLVVVLALLAWWLWSVHAASCMS